MQLILKPEQLSPEGLSVTVEGFTGDIGHQIPSQVFVEFYEDKLRVHVWTGSEDPEYTTEIQRL